MNETRLPTREMLQLRQHIQYAAEKGILNIVDQYLRNLAQGDWYFFGN
jgi:hypothetical protein